VETTQNLIVVHKFIPEKVCWPDQGPGHPPGLQNGGLVNCSAACEKRDLEEKRGVREVTLADAKRVQDGRSCQQHSSQDRRPHSGR